MQKTENDGEVYIIILDETYGGDEETYEDDSEKYRLELENEFNVSFEEVNVGPGADIPAFLTIIATTEVPLWSLWPAAFFLGKPIRDNLEAWLDIGRKIKGFFGRPVVLARHGASVIALEAVFDSLGGMPKSIKLLSYRPHHIADPDDLTAITRGNKICDNVPTLNLGTVRHIFEIEADGQEFRVSVEGKDTNVLRL